MRTLIQGGWVVGFDGNGHVLIPDGCVVFEGDQIVYVGRRFDGQVDRTVDARGKLVSPGFVNCHLHASVNAGQTVFIEPGKTDYFGSNFIGYVAPRRGTKPPRGSADPQIGGTYGMWSALRCGATTILDVGTMPGGPDAFTKLVGDLGLRAYLGPGFRAAEYCFEGDRVMWDWDEAQGKAGLARAIDYVKKHDGAYDGRIRAMIYPGQMDTCTVDLLRDARRAADDLGVPVQLHAAMNQREFHKILEQHGKTPIELLHSIGFLKPRTGLGHCVFHNRHSWCHYPYGDDLGRLADSGTTVVHAPYKYAKMGITFESFARYRERGINIAIGTDTYPQDIVHEMRWAMLMSRMADESFVVGKARDVFDAATLGGAASPRARRPRPAGAGREGGHHRGRPAAAPLRRRARPDQGARRVRERARRRARDRRRPHAGRGRPRAARGRARAARLRAGGERAAVGEASRVAPDRQGCRRDRAAELSDQGQGLSSHAKGDGDGFARRQGGGRDGRVQGHRARAQPQVCA